MMKSPGLTVVLGIGKPKRRNDLPPKSSFGRPEPESEPEGNQPERPEPTEPAIPPSGGESAAYEQKMHDLAPGAKFPPENVNYHESDAYCQECHHWDAAANECKVVANAKDPYGWCSLFPGEYAKDEMNEKPEYKEAEEEGPEAA